MLSEYEILKSQQALRRCTPVSVARAKAIVAAERKLAAAQIADCQAADRLRVCTLIDTYGAALIASWLRDYAGAE